MEYGVWARISEGVYPGWQVVVAGLGGGPRIGIARGWWGKPGPPREG